jgi:hypothetical protein
VGKLIPIVVLLTACVPALGQAQLHQGEANFALTFYLGDGNALPMTGATVVPFLSKNGGAWAAASGACSEVGKGVYKIAGNATDTNTLGILLIDANYPAGFTAERTYQVVRTDPQNNQNGAMSDIPALDGNAWTRSRYLAAVVEANLRTEFGIADANAWVRGRYLASVTEANLRLVAGALEANAVAVILTRGTGTSTLTSAQTAVLLAQTESNVLAGTHWVDPNLGYLAMFANRDANWAFIQPYQNRDANLAAIYVKAAVAGADRDANWAFLAVAGATVQTYLDATVSSVAASSGTGANAFNVIIVNASGSTAIQGASARMTLNATNILVKTGADGNALFNVDNGTWTVAASMSGYDGNRVTKAVSAAGYQIVKLNAVVTPAAALPDMCSVSVTFYSPDGTVAAGRVIQFMLKTAPTGSGVAYIGTTKSATSSALGVAATDLWRGAVYEAFCQGVKIGNDLTIPNAASYVIPSIKVK